MCSVCKKKPVYEMLNHDKLCKNCFIKYFERKVFKTIRKYQLIDKKDVIVAGLSGGKDSVSMLYLLDKYLKKSGRQVQALLINEGIEGYRNQTIVDAETFCKEYDIPLTITSFRKDFGKDLDTFLKTWKKKPCTPCGVFRRYLLNKYARKLGATKLAVGHNLDDEAQSILMNQLKGNMQLSAKLGPVTGALVHKQFILRVKPLYFMTEKEVSIYAFLKKFPVKFIECPNFHHNFRDQVGQLLNELEFKYPGSKHGFIQAFLQVLPSLRQQYTHEEIGTCKTCGEPASHEKCKACELLGR